MCGEEKETFSHLFYACEATVVTRRELFLDRHPEPNQWTPRQLLDFSYTEPVNGYLTDKDYLLEQPILELNMNYSITDSDSSL